MFRWRDILVLSSVLSVACDVKDEAEDDEDSEDTEEVYVEPSEYGPENSWWHALESDVPADLEGTGYGEGDIAYNFQLNDQYGNEVELYQFYGQVIVIDAFAEW
jgi:cytochrome oxidase Cu insertion factor (SCO1/SenC/PrrC family)